MGKTLDFNKIKKNYLTIILADEKKTTLMIKTPDKKTVDELKALEKSLTEVDEDNVEAIDDLYYSCAKIMSNNKGGIRVTKDMLLEIFDFEDIIYFFNAYMEFIEEISKN